MENADSHYRLVPNTKNEIFIEEKFPGAAKEKPFKFRIRLQFDLKTPEGRAAHEAWKRFEETGEALSLPAPHFDNLELPEFVTSALGMEFIFQEMKAHSVPGTVKIRMNLTIESKSGQTKSWSDVVLENVQGGTKQITWSNENQGIPLKLRLTVPIDDPQAQVSLAFNPDSLNVKEAAEGLRFFLELSKGGRFTFESAATGAVIGTSHLPADSVGVSPEFVEFVEALALIQRKTSLLFTVPETISLEDNIAVLSTAETIKTGRAKSSEGATVNIRASATTEFMRQVEDCKPLRFQVYYDNVTTLIYGKRIFLGEALLTGDFYVAPDDFKTLQDAVGKTFVGTSDLIATLTPIEGSVQAQFVDWLPAEEAEKVRNLDFFKTNSLGHLITLLFESSRDANGRIILEEFTSLLEEARNQIADDGQHLNLLPSCEQSEFYKYLAPLLSTLDQQQSEALTSHLIDKGWLQAETVRSLSPNEIERSATT